MQASVYTGYKKLHGIKNLSVQLANGLSYVYGPILARRNDIDTINLFGLVILMEALHAQTFDRVENNRVNRGERFTLFGDGMFRHLSANFEVLTSYHMQIANFELAAWQVDENRLFQSIRQHIEHSYGSIETIFTLCAGKKYLN
jgi:hypothetical protein